MPFPHLPVEKHHRQPSLFGEVLDWMLAPLLIIWPISMAREYSLAAASANAAYDRELRDAAQVVARYLRNEEGVLTLDIRDAGRQILVAGDMAEKVFQVRDRTNEVVDGDRELPAAEFTPDMEPRKVYFRDDYLRNREVRVAYVFAQVEGLPGAALVQVAETPEKRVWLASSIIGGVLAAQFVILPLAMMLVWFGLTKGIAPLNELADAVRRRRRNDLSPIDVREAPEEVRPFVSAMNELVRRLEQSLLAQERFVADAAHQMRTPLAGLRMQAEFALRQRDPAGIEHAMRQIATGAEHATRVVNQLLALARADIDAVPAMERQDMVVLAREAVGEWAMRALERSIDVGYEPGDIAAGGALVDGNADLLHEMLSNLVDNAIRYTPANGRVTVRVHAAGERVTLEVEDNGIGIAPSDRALVFERFYRVLGTGAEGSGLGLAIVRGIAESHVGEVSIGDNPTEHGTLVRVVLPRRRAAVLPLRAAG
jgi:two-component system sensor histidine kinase TctE